MSKTKKGMPKWLDVTLRVIEWTLIVFIVMCMLILLSQKITGNTPELFGYSTYTVVTDSMSGTYDVGDVVLCKRTKDPTKYQQDVGYKEGDVIAFLAPHGFDKDDKLQGQTITHRIVTAPFYDEETDTWFVETKGDAVAIKDRVAIPIDNIQGVIIGSSKALTALFGFLANWYGFLIVIVVPLSAILIWQIIVLIKAKEAEQKEKIEKESKAELEQAKQTKLEEIKAKAIEEYKQSLEEKDKKELTIQESSEKQDK